MTVRGLPPEVWSNVLLQLSSHKFETPKDHHVQSTFSPELAACAASCRTLSVLSGPHLFRTITLSSKVARVEALIELISINSMISRWITHLTIRPRACSHLEQHLYYELWLGTDIGPELMRRLMSLRSLFMHDFRPLRYSSHDVELDSCRGWANLHHLRSLTSLILCDCEFPSLQDVATLLIHTLPRLENLDITGYQLLESPDESSHAATLIARIIDPTLRTMTLNYVRGSSSYISALLGSLECPALTRLTLIPTQNDDDDDSEFTFQYAQPLLSNAPALICLTFLDCDYILPNNQPPLLASNSNIKNISIKQIGDDFPCTWIPELLMSLAMPSQLETLEVQGDLSYPLTDVWHALNEALSDKRFECVSGGRTLRIVKRELQASEECLFSRTNLPRTQVLGWFRIEWPEKQAG